MVLSSSQLAQYLIFIVTRNFEQLVEMITGHIHWLKHILRMGTFAAELTYRKCAQQENRFGLVSKDNRILQENIAGCILGF